MKSRPVSPHRKPKRSRKAPGEATRAPTYEDLVQIVELLRSASQFSEFRLRSGGIEVEVRRANGAAPPAPRSAAAAHGDPAGGEVTLEPDRAALQVPHARADLEMLPPGLELVRAPMVGTFYCSPEPGAPPYVAPGTRVSAESVVGIIEVMKLMNSISAGCAGVVTHVLVENAGAVEFGQPLVAIDPGP